jgi:hypothetical protein
MASSDCGPPNPGGRWALMILWCSRGDNDHLTLLQLKAYFSGFQKSSHMKHHQVNPRGHGKTLSASQQCIAANFILYPASSKETFL